MKLNPDPSRNCPRCPRLVEYRLRLREKFPDWWNAPVLGWGDPDAWLLIVGLAPGVKGANRTGRPFTGDYAGTLLYATLEKLGLTQGVYAERPDDGLRLKGTFIHNAVACVPPENLPLPIEIQHCRSFLEARIVTMPRLRTVVALGAIAHQSAVKVLGGKLPKHRFAHGAVHEMKAGIMLIDSYHCSRYNTNTGKLTPDMFEAVFKIAIETQTSSVSRP